MTFFMLLDGRGGGGRLWEREVSPLLFRRMRKGKKNVEEKKGRGEKEVVPWLGLVQLIFVEDREREENWGGKKKKKRRSCNFSRPVLPVDL